LKSVGREAVAERD